ncbi:trypsin-like peptidase domain-containing protein [Oligosphaera ethanolica]|uniref:S1-C subfamily serine protease/tetratricopeptide (TPR) repeat protein n=1 Tax=Oligosphaera ethanolica TaxID=760260 RepID=A0AAE4APC2_9BACT|nr:trypsin-like peptidase domain-containing protein [Oligosphaera ethanolica]MDQ0290546.1 S1-C subfamily serine protease/tetratricopeptide (TPR) repeat protein [Oligosphaera ethanolica]
MHELVNETEITSAYRGRGDGEADDKLVRVFNATVPIDAERAGRLRMRVEALRQLDSTKLVRYEAVEQDADGTWFVVSEWVDCVGWGDVTGKERLFRDPRRKREWVDLFAKMAQALAALHVSGQVVPNLKQADFLLVRRQDGTYDVKLDCSLEPFLREPGTANIDAGHPDSRAGRALDGRSDIWSMGTIYIALVAGCTVTADNAVAVIEGILNRFAPVVLHRKLGALLRSMVDDDPDKRPTSATAVAEAISAVTDQDIAKWVRFAKDPWKNKRLHRRFAWTAAIAVAVVLTVTAEWIRRERSDTEEKIEVVVDGLKTEDARRLAAIRMELDKIDINRHEQRLDLLSDAYKQSLAFVVVEVWEEIAGRRNSLMHASGSAFLVSSDGYLLSNRHVACPWLADTDLAQHFAKRAAQGEQADFGYTMYLWFEGDEAFYSRLITSNDVRDLYRTGNAYCSEGNTPKRVEIVAVNPMPVLLADRERGLQDDVAVLKVNVIPAGALPIPLAKTDGGDAPTRAMPVMAIGFPYGKDPIVGSQVVANWTRGTVTSVYADTLGIDATLHSGNSGGPVIDIKGRAVGIATAVFMARMTEITAQGQTVQRRVTASDMGRVLPIAKAVELLERARAGEPCQRGIPEYAYRRQIESAKAAAVNADWRQAAAETRDMLEPHSGPGILYWAAVLSPTNADASKRAQALDWAVAMQPDHYPAHFLRYCDDWQQGVEVAKRRSRDTLLAADWRSQGEFFGSAVKLIEAAAGEKRLAAMAETVEEAAVLDWVAVETPGTRLSVDDRRKLLLSAFGKVDPDAPFAYVIRYSLDRLGPWTEPTQKKHQRQGGGKDANLAFVAKILAELDHAAATPRITASTGKTSPTRSAYVEDAFLLAANGDWHEALRLAEKFLLEAPSARCSAHCLRVSLLRAQLLASAGDRAPLQAILKGGDAWYAKIARALLDASFVDELIKDGAGDIERTLRLRLALGMASELDGAPDAALGHYRDALDTMLVGRPEFTMAQGRIEALAGNQGQRRSASTRSLIPRAMTTPSWLGPTGLATRKAAAAARVPEPLRESSASRVARWEALGVLSPETVPAVHRAFTVYGRVLRSADKRSKYLPTADSLRVVDGGGDPWALALPDGHIVLSRRALDLCFADVPTAEGDARLAFVLGHELSHLAADDFRHLQAYLFFAEPEHGDEAVRRILREGGDAALLYGDNGDPAERAKAVGAMRAAELQADISGFLYAAIAGFRVDLLAGDGSQREDFFAAWVRQVAHGAEDPRHPDAATRAHVLRRRLGHLQDCVSLFDAGVLFLTLGQYDIALPLFETYQRVFPSREVFNNLGLCYLRRSQPYGIAGLGTLDTTTRAQFLGFDMAVAQISGQDLSEPARGDLGYAIACFEQACQADAAYVPARLNLATTSLLLGADEQHSALGALDQVLALDSGHSQATLLRWLIKCCHEPDESVRAIARDRLAACTLDETIPVWLLQHAAQVLAVGGQDDAAKAFHAAMQSRTQGTPVAPGTTAVAYADLLTITWPVAPGRRVVPDEEPPGLRDYRRVDFHAGCATLADALYLSDNGTMVAVVDEIVRGGRLVYDTPEPLSAVFAAAPADECVLPTGDRVLSSGHGDALLVRHGNLSQYWLVHQE